MKSGCLLMMKYCPKCYGKIQKESGRCTKCGFSIYDLKKATNKQAKEQLRSGNGDLVLYSSELPSDLSKKKLLLYCGLLGLFGAHYFYCGRMFRAMANFVISIFTIIIFVFTFFQFTSEFFKVAEYVTGLAFAFILILTTLDFVNIALNKFKVPVYLDED